MRSQKLKAYKVKGNKLCKKDKKELLVAKNVIFAKQKLQKLIIKMSRHCLDILIVGQKSTLLQDPEFVQNTKDSLLEQSSGQDFCL